MINTVLIGWYRCCRLLLTTAPIVAKASLLWLLLSSQYFQHSDFAWIWAGFRKIVPERMHFNSTPWMVALGWIGSLQQQNLASCEVLLFGWRSLCWFTLILPGYLAIYQNRADYLCSFNAAGCGVLVLALVLYRNQLQNLSLLPYRTTKKMTFQKFFIF